MTDYLETAVFTASPAALHGMLADAAVRHATAAAAALENGDREAGHLACAKASGCVGELLSGLNADAAGGAMRETVEAITAQFAFCLRNLAEADRAGDAAPAAAAARVLTVHAETWRELRAALGGDPAPAAPVTPAAAFAPAAFTHAPAPTRPPVSGYGDEPTGMSWAA